MKNITIALDDETHRQARIRAAELGTSLSALVKEYLNSLSNTNAPQEGVREMPMPYKVAPAAAPPATSVKGPQGQPYFVGGKWVYTKDGKPRKPGSMRHVFGNWDGELGEWPDDILASFEAWPYDDPDYKPEPWSEV